MDAGRELDALIAEKVLKIPLCRKRFVKWTISGVLNYWDCPEHGLNGCVLDLAVPPYSTDIGAAWQVVEYMLSCGKYISIRPITNGEWWAEWDGPGQPREGRRTAATAPLAICRAALAAVSAEVPA